MNGLLHRHHEEPSCGLACASPRRMVSQLMQRLRQMRRSRLAVGTRRQEASNGGDPGQRLVQLITATNTELRKIQELRLELQMHVFNARQEALTRNAPGPLDNDSVGSCMTNMFLRVPSFNSRISSPSVTFPPYHNPPITNDEEDAAANTSSPSTLCYEPEKEPVEVMDPLEMELEAELQQLQLQLDEESSSHSMVKISGANGSPKEATSEVDGGGGGGGVAPDELERKLHELFEHQQRERIKELETALVSAKRKISNRDNEMSLLRDINAQLVLSGHVPEEP